MLINFEQKDEFSCLWLNILLELPVFFYEGFFPAEIRFSMSCVKLTYLNVSIFFWITAFMRLIVLTWQIRLFDKQITTV